MSSSTWKRSPAAATSLPRPLPISSTSTSSAPTPTNKTSAPGRSSSSSNLAGLSNSACFHLSSWIFTWTTPGDTMSLGTPNGKVLLGQPCRQFAEQWQLEALTLPCLSRQNNPQEQHGQRSQNSKQKKNHGDSDIRKEERGDG